MVANMKRFITILMFIFMLTGIALTIVGAMQYHNILMVAGIITFVVGAILHDISQSGE